MRKIVAEIAKKIIINLMQDLTQEILTAIHNLEKNKKGLLFILFLFLLLLEDDFHNHSRVFYCLSESKFL